MSHLASLSKHIERSVCFHRAEKANDKGHLWCRMFAFTGFDQSLWALVKNAKVYFYILTKGMPFGIVCKTNQYHLKGIRLEMHWFGLHAAEAKFERNASLYSKRTNLNEIFFDFSAIQTASVHLVEFRIPKEEANLQFKFQYMHTNTNWQTETKIRHAIWNGIKLVSDHFVRLIRIFIYLCTPWKSQPLSSWMHCKLYWRSTFPYDFCLFS